MVPHRARRERLVSIQATCGLLECVIGLDVIGHQTGQFDISYGDEVPLDDVFKPFYVLGAMLGRTVLSQSTRKLSTLSLDGGL